MDGTVIGRILAPFLWIIWCAERMMGIRRIKKYQRDMEIVSITLYLAYLPLSNVNFSTKNKI
jgi:hypothetical protein